MAVSGTHDNPDNGGNDAHHDDATTSPLLPDSSQPDITGEETSNDGEGSGHHGLNPAQILGAATVVTNVALHPGKKVVKAIEKGVDKGRTKIVEKIRSAESFGELVERLPSMESISPTAAISVPPDVARGVSAAVSSALEKENETEKNNINVSERNVDIAKSNAKGPQNYVKFVEGSQKPLMKNQKSEHSNPGSSPLLVLEQIEPQSFPPVFLLVGVFYSMYYFWINKDEVLSNDIPLSVFIPCMIVSFLLGHFITFISLSNQLIPFMDSSSIGDKNNSKNEKLKQKGSTTSRALSSTSATPEVDTDVNTTLARRHRLLHRIPFGRRYLKRMGSAYNSRKKLNPYNTVMMNDHVTSKYFWTSLSQTLTPASAFEEIKALEQSICKPISRVLMDHLLSYPDFHRKKTEKNNDGSVVGVEEVPVSEEIDREKKEGSTESTTGISLGHAKMHDTKAESLESDKDFSCLVDPLCSLRGMDLFATTDPEEAIWRQPLLIQSGLRDVPTFIGNMMLPFGNLTVYFKLPDWFDDWSNIPEETDEDPPDVKALKRFLAGDDDYRNDRIKIIPFVVDGPLAIRMIKPKPHEVVLHRDATPITWTRVPKSTSSSNDTATLSALMEADIDLLSCKAVRKVFSIVRPHIKTVTIDVALVITKPKDSDVDEPSACLGLWRIDRVDFDSCAVLPEKNFDEAVEVVKNAVTSSKETPIAVEVAA